VDMSSSAVLWPTGGPGASAMVLACIGKVAGRRGVAC